MEKTADEEEPTESEEEVDSDAERQEEEQIVWLRESLNTCMKWNVFLMILWFTLSIMWTVRPAEPDYGEKMWFKGEPCQGEMLMNFKYWSAVRSRENCQEECLEAAR